MKKLAASFIFCAAGACFGQQWEFGGVGGGSFLKNVDVSSPSGAAKAGFGNGAVFGAYVGQSIGKHLSGQIRYEYIQSDLKLSSGGSNVTFGGRSHLVHYDLIWHTKEEGSVQFFAAAGGGMRVFQGTGTEAAYQPLSQFGYFTKTSATKGMGSVGGGVRFRLTPKVHLNAEVRDFITAFPTKLIAPAPNTKYGSILNDFVPMIGIDYMF